MIFKSKKQKMLTLRKLIVAALNDTIVYITHDNDNITTQACQACRHSFCWRRNKPLKADTFKKIFRAEAISPLID